MSLRKFLVACFVVWLVALLSWKILDMNGAPRDVTLVVSFVLAVSTLLGFLTAVFALFRWIFRRR